MPSSAVLRQPKAISRRTPWLFALGLTIAVIALAWGGWSFWTTRRYRQEMAAIDAAMASGRFGLASVQLNDVLKWRPNADEAAFVLGLCEKIRGRLDAADLAWARNGPGSPFEQRAFLSRLRLFHDTGRLAGAEKLVLTSAEIPGYDRTQLLVMLVPIYSQIGRSDDAEQLIEERWNDLRETGRDTQEQSINLLRPHIELTLKAATPENLRLYLDQMGGMAADDDRVWLGRANLAIQTGAFDEAKKWLDLCQNRRPNDPAVWKAWLRWGLATHRPKLVEQAIAHVPAGQRTLADIHRVAAWLCEERGDKTGERQELESLLANAPTDLKAFERLSTLDGESAKPKFAVELERKRSEIDQLWSRYSKLHARNQHIRDAEEMARLAEALGRCFEARVSISLALSEEPEREDLKREFARLGQKLSTTDPRAKPENSVRPRTSNSPE